MKEIKSMVESIISQKERKYLMYKKEGINTIVEWMDKELASWRNILKAVEESELECDLRNKILEQECELESNLKWNLLNVVENRYALEPYAFMRTYLTYVR